MAKKTSKAEWDAFLADDAIWGNLFYDDALFEVDGEEVEDVDDGLDETTVVSIKDGVVVDQESMEAKGTLTGLFQKWKKKQTTRRVVVEVPAEVTDKQLKEQLKAIKGTVA